MRRISNSWRCATAFRLDCWKWHVRGVMADKLDSIACKLVCKSDAVIEDAILNPEKYGLEKILDESMETLEDKGYSQNFILLNFMILNEGATSAGWLNQDNQMWLLLGEKLAEPLAQ